MFRPIPVFQILEARGLEVKLVNAHHVKTVPGRKTDVNDFINDFYENFELNYGKQLKLSTDDKRKPCQSRLCISEVMTIMVLFHTLCIQDI